MMMLSGVLPLAQACDIFKASEHSIVVENSPPDYHVFSGSEAFVIFYFKAGQADK